MSIEYKIKRISKNRYETVTDNTFVIKSTDLWYEYVTVPKGFQSDLAAVPWIARCLIKPDDSDIIEAAIIHDYLVGQFGDKGGVRRNDKYGIQSQQRQVSWEEAAHIMKRVMIHDGAPRWKKNIVYYAGMIVTGKPPLSPN